MKDYVIRNRGFILSSDSSLALHSSAFHMLLELMASCELLPQSLPGDKISVIEVFN